MSKVFTKSVLAGLFFGLLTSSCFAEVTSLRPIRKSTKISGYTLDTVGDKESKPGSKTIRIIVRVSGADKKPVKPKSILLVDAGGTITKPEDREDRKVGNEENSGLPLTVNSSANSQGGGGVGIGLNLNKLFADDGVYSYTKVDFLKEKFVAGQKFQVTMPDGKILTVPLGTLAR